MMNSKAKRLAVIVLAGTVFTGCSSSYYSKVPGPFTSNVENQESDNINYQNKLQKLVDKQFPKAEVKIVADHFNVLVVGQVPNQETKDGILDFVSKRHGTGSIFDYMLVAPKPSLKYSSSITSDVKDRLKEEQDIDYTKVTVATVDGVVYLLGTNVGDLTHLARAIKGIYTIDGVTKVVNLVKPGPGDYYSTY